MAFQKDSTRSEKSYSSDPGNMAVTSIIQQYQAKCKEKDLLISSLKQRDRSLVAKISTLEDKVRSLEKENEQLHLAVGESQKISPRKERHHDVRTQNKPDLQSHGLSTTSAVQSSTGNSDAKVARDVELENDQFCSEIFHGKLSQDREVQQKFMDLAGFVGQKCAKLGELHRKFVSEESQVKLLISISRFVFKFFTLLEITVGGTGSNANKDLPPWLATLFERRDTDQYKLQKVGQVWRILLWALQHPSDKQRKRSSITQEEIDDWYARKDVESALDAVDVTKAWEDLLKAVNAEVNVHCDHVPKELSMLSLIDSENAVAESSEESSLTSKIAPEELWSFKSIVQGLVERFEVLTRELGMLKEQVGAGVDDLDAMEKEMYLPQREALETYDLGNLMKLMNHVIQDLSMKLMASRAESRLCANCMREYGDGEAGDRSIASYARPDILDANSYPFSLRSQRGGHRPSRGLQSGEPRDHVNVSIPVLPAAAAEAVPPVVRARPRPMASRQIHTIQASTNTLTRTKSDSSPEKILPRRRDLMEELSASKSGSLDSVFAPAKNAAGTYSNVPLNNHGPNSGTSSDSDDDIVVCGPPDTPPEVRAYEKMRTLPASASGQAIYGMEPTLTYGMEGGFGRRNQAGTFPYSQVQQCTGDNSNTRQDMLLPTSVEWSTVQLKEGGLPAPTPADMSRYSTSFQMANKSIKDRQCAECHIKFRSDDSSSTIYEHIQSHFKGTTPENSLGRVMDSDVVTDGIDTPRNIRTQTGGGKETRCPVCNMAFPDYVPLQARESHINLHFDENGEFEVVTENYGATK